MADQPEALLHNCLYFTANSLARQISQMAEEEFRFTGLSPSHAFLLMLVNQQPGINQKELGNALHLAPSTVTRFVDSLQGRHRLVERRSQGKLAKIYPTARGQEMQKTISRCWHALYERYTRILGPEDGADLVQKLDRASQKLQE